MANSLLSFWQTGSGERGLGNASLLDQPLTAFFASRQCPGTAIRAAMDWAIEQARSRNPIISGFHSPLEQSVLEVLLTAKSPCVIVIARNLEQAKLPPHWLQAVQNETMAVVSIENTQRRLTAELATRRNEWVTAHATHIVVAHASAGGFLARHIDSLQQAGRHIESCQNCNLNSIAENP